MNWRPYLSFGGHSMTSGEAAWRKTKTATDRFSSTLAAAEGLEFGYVKAIAIKSSAKSLEAYHNSKRFSFLNSQAGTWTCMRRLILGSENLQHHATITAFCPHSTWGVETLFHSYLACETVDLKLTERRNQFRTPGKKTLHILNQSYSNKRLFVP